MNIQDFLNIFPELVKKHCIDLFVDHKKAAIDDLGVVCAFTDELLSNSL